MARTAVLVTSALAVAALGLQISTAHGTHSWSNYHWARADTGTHVVFTLEHNLTSEKWNVKPSGADKTFLEQASGDWSAAAEIHISGINYPNPPDAGKCEVKRNFSGPLDSNIDVCSKEYGFKGWLGLAQIWVIDGHIIKGVAKLNDSYFKSGTYDDPLWRDLVMCQEVGHVFGLGHQDEDFYNDDLKDIDGVETCMDYTNRPAGNGQPNQHDYDQLELIYDHPDSDGNDETVDNTGPGNGKGGRPNKGGMPGKLVSVSGFEFATYVRNDPSEWGTAVAFTDKGQPRVFVKDQDNGVTVVTHVTWTEDARAGVHFPHRH
jgi:hypothetical protein